jgi:hypothetical protein
VTTELDDRLHDVLNRHAPEGAVLDVGAVVRRGQRALRRRRVLVSTAGLAVVAAAVGIAAAVWAGSGSRDRIVTTGGPSGGPAGANAGAVPLPSQAPAGVPVTAGSVTRVRGALAGDSRCVWLTTAGGARASLVWPAGWTYDPAAARIYGADGTTYATVGETLDSSGVPLTSFPAGDNCVVADQGYALYPTNAGPASASGLPTPTG